MKNTRLKMNEISITDHTKPRSITIYFPKNVVNIIGKREVVIKEDGESLMIREALIMDNKTFKINKEGSLSYTSTYAKEYIGRWSVEESEGWLYLFKEG